MDFSIGWFKREKFTDAQRQLIEIDGLPDLIDILVGNTQENYGKLDVRWFTGYFDYTKQRSLYVC